MSPGVGDIWTEIQRLQMSQLGREPRGRTFQAIALNEGRFLFQSSSMWHLGELDEMWLERQRPE